MPTISLRRLVPRLAGMSLALLAAVVATAQPAAAPDADAVRAFKAVLDAYRAQPALEVRSELQIKLDQGQAAATSEKVVAKFTYARGRKGWEDAAGRLEIRGYVYTFRDGLFSAIHTEKEDRYYQEKFEGSPYWIMFSAFQDLPYPHLALLWGEAEERDVWMQLNLNETPGLVPTTVVDETKDGVALRRIGFVGPNGSLDLWVDPKTKFLVRGESRITSGPMVQNGATKTVSYVFTQKVPTRPVPPQAFVLEPGDRQRVDVVVALAPAPKPPVPNADIPPAGPAEGGMAGQVAPAFTLATAEGDAIDLGDLRGSVVVLDFWATWCNPCRKALPILHEVADWAKEQGLPVVVIPVNVWEISDPAADSPDARLASVQRFWKAQGFHLTVAMDYSDATAEAYGVGGIPATFVIRPDGVIHDQPYPTVAGLRESIRGAMAATPKDGGE